MKSPEEIAALDGRSLLQQTRARQTDMIDGLQTTGDLLNKVIDMLSDLQLRVRYLEERHQTPPPTKRLGCGLSCHHNTLKL